MIKSELLFKLFDIYKKNLDLYVEKKTDLNLTLNTKNEYYRIFFNKNSVYIRRAKAFFTDGR